MKKVENYSESARLCVILMRTKRTWFQEKILIFGDMAAKTVKILGHVTLKMYANFYFQMSFYIRSSWCPIEIYTAKDCQLKVAIRFLYFQNDPQDAIFLISISAEKF